MHVVQSLFFSFEVVAVVLESKIEISKNDLINREKNSVFQPQMALRVPPAILDHLLDIRITSP